MVAAQMPPLVCASSGLTRVALAYRDRRRVFMKLAVEVWMVVYIHTALKNLSILGSVKKPSCDPKRGDAITASPSFTDFAAL